MEVLQEGAMARFPLVFLFAAAACRGGAPDAVVSSDPIPLVTITGRVLDSLLGTPVADARVFGGTNGAVSLTDQYGYYRLEVNQEPSSIRVSDWRYEDAEVDNDFTRSRQIDLRLVRFAPAILRCTLESGEALAIVMDLQGRKTVDRRMTSHAVATTASGSSSSLGYDWLWYPVDNLTWSVQIPVPAGTSSLSVTVADADLNTSTRACNDPAAGQPPG